jgi:phospholipid:diacylglycerol acyltransferase
MHLAAYDWRLSYYNLEVRDAYFSRLQMLIEHNLKRQRKKTVLVAHSMGSQVMLYFFKWVEAKDFGGGGPDWVERHIESFLSVYVRILCCSNLTLSAEAARSSGCPRPLRLC